MVQQDERRLVAAAKARPDVAATGGRLRGLERDVLLREQPSGCKSLVDPSSTACNDRAVVGTLQNIVAFAIDKFELRVIEHAGGRPHDSEVEEAAVSFHDPSHDGQQLAGTGDVDDLEMSNPAEDLDVVVAHMRGSVGLGLKVWCRSEEGQVQSVPCAQPSIGHFNGF